MTRRRFATSPTKSPTRTGGNDQPRPNCADQPDAFDVLIDSASGPEYRSALAAARSMCLGFDGAPPCPLVATCHAANRDEPWVRAILGVKKKPPTKRVSCGTNTGATMHYKAGEKCCPPCLEGVKAYKAQKRAERGGMSKAQWLEVGRAERRARTERFAAERVADLRALVESGAGITEACDRLEISRDSLYSWCRKNGHGGIYEALCRRERRGSNQHARVSAA